MQENNLDVEDIGEAGSGTKPKDAAAENLGHEKKNLKALYNGEDGKYESEMDLWPYDNMLSIFYYSW